MGRDFASVRSAGSPARRRLAALSAGLLAAALSLAALRVDLIRVRYGLAQALAREKELLEQHREVTAEVSRLRDPGELRKQAAALGLARPERCVDLRGDPLGGERVR